MRTLTDTLGLLDTLRGDDRITDRHLIKAEYYRDRVANLDVTVGEWRVTTGTAVVTDINGDHVLEVFDVLAWWRGQAVPIDPHRQWVNPPVRSGLTPEAQVVGDVIDHTVKMLGGSP